MALELGRTCGGYEIIDIVDSDWNGIAYKVRNLRNNRFEMLRVLSRAVQEDPERSERFLREASVHERLVHPNIVVFYGATVLEDQFVITTELVEGVTLEQRLELGPLPITEALAIGLQALAALGCAHDHGVVHRDVRPANLILTPDGLVKLTGFTLAKSASDPHLTRMGASLGEVHYMSPEQVRGTQAPDPRSDIYSLGVVLFEAVTGRRPFEHTSQFEVMQSHVSVEPAAPSTVNPAVSAELDAVILKALAKQSLSRFADCATFWKALQALLPSAHSEPLSAPAPAPPPPAEPAVDLPPDLAAIRFGLRDAVSLTIGVLVMVASVLLVSRLWG